MSEKATLSCKICGESNSYVCKSAQISEAINNLDAVADLIKNSELVKGDLMVMALIKILYCAVFEGNGKNPA
jgi:hypothetical protein